MHPEAREESRVRFKLAVLEYAKHIGGTKACREFDVPRSTFYEWKQKYDQDGRSGLYYIERNPSPIAAQEKRHQKLLRRF